MIVASTMVPVATFTRRLRDARDPLEQLPAEIVRLQQVAERHTVVSSGTGSRPRSMPTKRRIASEL